MRECKPWGYWNVRENCFNAALECETKMEFIEKYSSAYYKALEKGWITDYTWFKLDRKPKGFWKVKENCFEAAKECTCRSEFIDKYYQAYANSIENGWITDYTWFITPDIKKHEANDFEIYVFDFTDLNAVYVGISCIPIYREHQHNNDETSSVFKFAKEHGVKIPKLKSVMRELSGEEAQWAEGWYVDAYRDMGKTIINKAKTGIGSSSLGLANYKWTKENCLDAAISCTTKKEFYTKYPGAAKSSQKNGWYSSYTWLKDATFPKGYWNVKENCIKAGLECKTKSEFKDKYYMAWWNCLKNNWMEEIEYHFKSNSRKRGFWDVKENIINAAKECKTRKEFHEKYSSAWAAAKRHGWYDEISKLFEKTMNPSGYWTRERCEEECKKYKCISDVKKYCSACYSSIYKHGWLHDFFPNKSLA